MTEKHTPLKNLRKLPVSKRQKALQDYLSITPEEVAVLTGKIDGTDLADVLIESAIGTFPVPLGLATGFFIDGKEYVIPMATEEPSVISAASHAAMLIRGGGGFKATAAEPVVTAQIFLVKCAKDAKEKILSFENIIKKVTDSIIPNMVLRGGGYRGIEVEEADLSGSLSVSIHIDVRDAMGANIANTVAEGLKETLIKASGGRILMAILTNASEHRCAKATFEVPEKYFRKGTITGKEVSQRIVDAYRLAAAFPRRAVTHNKGIMNGISALATATGNDTRAVEAAAHFFASKSGKHLPLTSYSYESGKLKGSIEIPLPLGTTGGSIGIWPAAKLSLKILGNPQSGELSRIAASLGLAQNLAALFALVTDGIQSGHMKLHAAKIAYEAGARGDMIRILASKLWSKKTLDLASAEKLLKEMEEKR